MDTQPRLDPLEPSRYFPDGRSARPPVPGTRTVGESRDRGLVSGLKPGVADHEPALDRAGEYATEFPFAVTPEVMRRGRAEYDISCAVCHDRHGTGSGPVVAASYPPAQSFHTDRLRQAPAGYLFEVVTRGNRAMPAHDRQIPARDRWAVVAYVRALQLSQHAELQSLPPEIRQKFSK
jgi:mono/diheme cytochrome c family protein